MTMNGSERDRVEGEDRAVVVEHHPRAASRPTTAPSTAPGPPVAGADPAPEHQISAAGRRPPQHRRADRRHLADAARRRAAVGAGLMPLSDQNAVGRTCSSQPIALAAYGCGLVRCVWKFSIWLW